MEPGPRRHGRVDDRRLPDDPGQPALDKLVDEYPEALKAFIGFGGGIDYATGAGYLGIELFSFMVPLLLLVAAIGAGARAIAGAQERGTLDLLLANPVSRRRLVAEKLAALAAELLILALVLWLALLAGVAAFDLDVSAAHLARCNRECDPPGRRLRSDRSRCRRGRRTYGRRDRVQRSGCRRRVPGQRARRSRRRPRAAPEGIALHYAEPHPLHHGLSPSHALFLLGVAAAASVLAVVRFERRDLAA